MTEVDPIAEAERAILGTAMTGTADIADLGVAREDFADKRHGALWALIGDMARQGEATTAVAVLNALPRLKKDRQVGTDDQMLAAIDGPLLFDIYASRPVAALADKYARIVTNNGAIRRLRMAAMTITQLAGEGADAQTVAEQARAEIDAANRNGVALAHYIGETIDHTLDTFEQPTSAVPTPWPDLNALLSGWRPGALYVVGARPGVGKTIVGLQAAIGLSDHGHVALNSLEMPEREIHARAVAQLARVPLGRLHGQSQHAERLTESDWLRISSVRGRLAEMPLSVDDRSAVTVLDIRSHARTVSRRGRLAGIVVDYLQLMSSPAGDRRPRHEVVAEYSRGLKLLAKEFDCPVIALSQLNRGSENREDKRPQLSDLRESGAVEQDADVVILLHSPDEKSTDLDMAVAKNRHGVRGPVKLTRRGEFSMLEPRHGASNVHHLPQRRDLA